MAPLVYPSCPYKTPLLPPLTKLVTILATKALRKNWLPNEEMTIKQRAGRLSGEALAWLGMCQSTDIYHSVVRAIGAAFERFTGAPDLYRGSLVSLGHEQWVSIPSNAALAWNIFIADFFKGFVPSPYQTMARIQSRIDTSRWTEWTSHGVRAHLALVRSGYYATDQLARVGVGPLAGDVI